MSKRGMMVKTFHEPKRMEYAITEITKLGYEITFQCDTRIEFMFKGHLVKHYPYTGWHTGKSIIDGRGIENLIKQIKL